MSITCSIGPNAEHKGIVTSWRLGLSNTAAADIECTHCGERHRVIFDEELPQDHWPWVLEVIRDYQKALVLLS